MAEQQARARTASAGSPRSRGSIRTTRRPSLRAAVKAGAVGVMQLANVVGEELTDERFAPVWAEIDRLGLPVLIHPGTPPGMKDMNLGEFGMVPPIGFMIDTTLAFARMIFSGFLDKYPNVKLIAAHGGATLPYLAGRLDRCHEMIPACSSVIKEKPSEYLKRIWYDTVVYDQGALEMCIAVAGSADRVLYGSDYPHNIGDMEGCLARVDALPAAQAKRVRGAAARELFRLWARRPFPLPVKRGEGAERSEAGEGLRPIARAPHPARCFASRHPLPANAGRGKGNSHPFSISASTSFAMRTDVEHDRRTGVEPDVQEDLADLLAA